MYVVVVPSIIGYLAYKTDVSRSSILDETTIVSPTQWFLTFALGSLGFPSEEEGRHCLRAIKRARQEKAKFGGRSVRVHIRNEIDWDYAGFFRPLRNTVNPMRTQFVGLLAV